MNNKRKKYVGSFADEKLAAILYDKVAILTHGMKVSLVYIANHYVLNRRKQTLLTLRKTYSIY
jgi:hypothetical protein